MKSRSHLVRQIFSLFALVRVQNVLLLSIAFILTAKYIFAPDESFKQLLSNINFDILLISTTLCIASGYIINSFYDYQKDLINRPQKTLIEQEVDLKKRLYLYFFLNFAAVFLAGLISWRAALFFSVYIFFIWLYSHKIQHFALLGNLTATLLSILPFFVIFLYFKKFNHFIFAHAVFLFLLLLIKDIIKNFINLKGDLAQGHQTLPVKYGENKAKALLLLISLLLMATMWHLNNFAVLGDMKYYFYIFSILYFSGLIIFLKSENIKIYKYFYGLIKILLVLGVFSIILVKKQGYITN